MGMLISTVAALGTLHPEAHSHWVSVEAETLHYRRKIFMNDFGARFRQIRWG
jgi:hypothetical protein